MLLPSMQGRNQHHKLIYLSQLLPSLCHVSCNVWHFLRRRRWWRRKVLLLSCPATIRTGNTPSSWCSFKHWVWFFFYDEAAPGCLLSKVGPCYKALRSSYLTACTAWRQLPGSIPCSKGPAQGLVPLWDHLVIPGFPQNAGSGEVYWLAGRVFDAWILLYVVSKCS